MLETWCKRQFDTCATLGIDAMAAQNYKRWLIEQGFEDVKELKYKWPIGSWPKDPRQKTLGKMTLVNTLTGLEGASSSVWSVVKLGGFFEVHQHYETASFAHTA